MGSLQESNKNIENDPKVTKLYRMLVMDNVNKAGDENQFQSQSLKTIAGNANIENSYEYLSKFGIDIGRIELGPAVVSKPDRILEALSLSDNFYLNLLDCSAESVLAVGLSRGIYLWKPSGSISRIR